MEEKRIQKGMEEELIRLLQSVFGDNLLSVMLYGSYVEGNFISKLSDINVLIILDEALSGELLTLGKGYFRFIRKHKITPLILSRDEFKQSSDVFPMEYMDIRSRSRVIFGNDETQPLNLTAKNLRHQLEYLLRGNIISLRQLLVASKGKKRLLKNSIKSWYGSLNALMRGLIHLKGADPKGFGTESNMDLAGELYGVNTAPLKDLIAFRSGEKIDPEKLVFDLIGSLESITRAVDTFSDGT